MTGLGPNNIALAGGLAGDDGGTGEQARVEVGFCSCRSAEINIHSRLWGKGLPDSHFAGNNRPSSYLKKSELSHSDAVREDVGYRSSCT